MILAAGLLGVGGCNNSFVAPSMTQPQATAKFAYVANQVSGTLSGYAVDPSTGSLTPLSGFPIASGVNPNFVVHDPQQRFVIVADIAASLLRVYGIDSTTGMLTEVEPSPYVVEQEPRSLAIDPTGRFVYVTSQALNSVTAFAIDAEGVLTPVTGSPFPTGGSAAFGRCVVVHQTGKFLYVEDLDNVYAFGIDSSSGALSLINTVAGPTQGGGLALAPSGSFLYAVGSGSNSAAIFSIDPITGVLTPSGTSPLALQDGAYTISIDPSGQFAYTVEAGQTLVAYSLQNGGLTPLGEYSGALGSLQLAIDPSGSFVYAPQTGSENNISGFRIGSSGILSALPGSPTPSGQGPLSITITSQ